MRKIEQSIERKLPEGMRFYLPEQAEMIAELARKGKNILTDWGYRPIFVPALLPYDTVVESLGEESVREYYKLIDYRGEILVLRPEMTAAIAERVTCDEDDTRFPGRYQYFAPVYRHETTQSGKKREIYQLGAEFLGNSSHGDVEILMLAQEILLECGIENFEVEIGHIGFLNQLLTELDISRQQAAELKSHLARRDLVSYRNLCETFSSAIRDKLLELLQLRGDEDIIARANSLLDTKDCEPLRQLQTIHQGLTDLNKEKNISFDLGLTRNLDYYSGLVFEIMSPTLGYNICGGGRYDKLLQKLGGKSISGRGFALGIERLRLIKAQQQAGGFGDDLKVLIRYQDNSSLQSSVEMAESLQKLNYATELDRVSAYKDGDELATKNLIIDVKQQENGKTVFDLRCKGMNLPSDRKSDGHKDTLHKKGLSQIEVTEIAEQLLKSSST